MAATRTFLEELMPRQFVILIQALVLLAFSFAENAEAQSIHGILRVVKGDVRIIQSADQKEIKARIGQKVYPKDVIIAAQDSRAKIVMIDNNELNISPDTRLEIQSYEYKPSEDKKTVMLNVLYGKVRAKVNQKYEGDNKFQVKTPSAVAGVRGTDFFTSYNRGTNETKIVTFEGKVAFGQAGAGGAILNPVIVAKGETTSQKGNATPSAPISVPQTELAEMETQSDATKAPDSSKDAREPAESNKADETKKDEDKKDEPKEEKKDNDNNRNKDKEKSKDRAGNKDESRSPSSIPSPDTMLKPDDFPESATPNVPTVPPVIGTMPSLPSMPTNYLPPKNDFVTDVISGTRKQVIINVTTGP